MKKSFARSSWRYVIAFVMPILTAACTTKLVRQEFKPGDGYVTFNQDVKYRLDSAMVGGITGCVAVLPVEADILHGRELVTAVRRTVQSRLAAKGYLLASSSQVDSVFASGADAPKIGDTVRGIGCNHIFSIRVTVLEKGFYGMYSEVKAGATMRLSGADKEIWFASHQVSLKGGGLPANPISAAFGIYSAAENSSDDQLERATDELIRKMLGTLPDATSSTALESSATIDVLSRYRGDIDAWLLGLPSLDHEHALVALARSSKLSDAEQEALFARLIDLADKSHYRRDRIYFRLEKNRVQSALAEAQELTQREPGDAKNWIALATANMQDMAWDDAFKALLHAAKLRPSDSRVYEKLGYVCGKMGNVERAKASFEKAIELDPDSAYANFNLAVLNIKSGNLEQVGRQLSLAGNAYARAGDKKNARRVLSVLFDLGNQSGHEDVLILAREFSEKLKD